MQLSIVVPFYNEGKNAPLILEAFKKFESNYDFELICVNDGSKDDTGQVLLNLKNSGQYPFLEIINYLPNAGYGNAIMTGVRAAKGEVIAWTHSDMQTPVPDVFRAFNLYRTESSKYKYKLLIKGWRTNRALPQVTFSFGMAFVSLVILRKWLMEINAQPKLFGSDFKKYLENTPKDFSLDLYLLLQAKKNNYEIKNIKVKFPERLHGQSSWAFSWQSKYKTIWRTVKYIWKLRKEL